MGFCNKYITANKPSNTIFLQPNRFFPSAIILNLSTSVFHIDGDDFDIFFYVCPKLVQQ